MIDPFDLLERQKVAADWLDWACRDGAVPERDDRYQRITEGRDKPTPGYSSCADLAHWMLFRLGVRLPWINRAENGVWHPGRNVSALCWPPAPAREPRAGDKYEAGDVLVIWSRENTTDAHVVCVLDHFPEEHRIETAEYGQPGGALKDHAYEPHGPLRIGLRPVHRVLLLADVLEQAERNGDLVDAEPYPVEAT